MQLKLLSWNVNGIRAVAKKGFIDWVKKSDADIIALQETKAHKEQLDETLLNIKPYSSYFSKPERKGYSGVALYTKLEVKNINFNFHKDFDSEGRFIEADFGDFILFNVYFPNGQMSAERLKYKLEFYDAFLEYIEKKRKENPNLIICGDVNTAHQEIDLARPKANENTSGFLRIERDWIDKFLSYGYVDTFRYFYPDKIAYSWWSMRTRARERNVGWRIDYFFVTKEFIRNVKDAFILNDVYGSDHCPIGIIVEI